MYYAGHSCWSSSFQKNLEDFRGLGPKVRKPATLLNTSSLYATRRYMATKYCQSDRQGSLHKCDTSFIKPTK